MTRVERKATPVTMGNAARAIARALRGFGLRVKPLLPFALATFAIETDRGRRMQNNNAGNVIAVGDPPSGDYWRPTWFEVSPGSSKRDRELHERMLRGEAPAAFRSFPAFEAGAQTFIRELFVRRPEVMTAALRGNAFGYADAVHRTAYCPDPECEPQRIAPTYRALLSEFGAGSRSRSRGRPVFIPVFLFSVVSIGVARRLLR